jgi:hypothetical protein
MREGTDAGDYEAVSTPLLELQAGDRPESWGALGFAIDAQGACRIGDVRVALDGSGGGLKAWTLSGPPGPETLDGLETRWELPRSYEMNEHPAVHPNGATAIDHIVVFTGDRERTARALIEAGGDLRRRRDPPAVPAPMAFIRFGPAIVEVAQRDSAGQRASFWGLVAVVPDVDALCAEYGEALTRPRDAVQPGRRIVTARRLPGLEVPLAFITPRAG